MTSPVPETVYSRYLDALLKGDSSQCRSIVQSLLDDGCHLLDLYEQLFRRSLYEVGDLWAKNLITVAEEHIATAITERLLSQLQDLSTTDGNERKRVVISCVTSDLHQIGAKMVANLFETHGWDTYFLGANMPITELLGAIDRVKPDVICLSLALIENLKTLEVTIREIRSNHPQTPIVAGGRAFMNLDASQHNLGQQPNVHLLHSVIQLERFIESV